VDIIGFSLQCALSGNFQRAGVIAINEGPRVSQFSSILVYCGSLQSSDPIRFATRIARSSGAHVTLGDTVEHLPDTTKQRALRKLAAQMRRSGVKPSMMLLQGEAGDAILEAIVNDQHDLLIVQAPVTGMFDSDRKITFRLTKESSVPILLARELRRRKRPKILAAVDATAWSPRDSDNLNSQLIETALSFAEHLDGDVHVLHVWEPVSEGPMRWAGVSTEAVAEYYATGLDHIVEELEKTIEPYGARMGAGRIHVEVGDPRSVIPEFARENDIDLIVIGMFARSGLSGRILGNSADTILDRSPCSMVVVPRRKTPASLGR
jgi:universal stress protein E